MVSECNFLEDLRPMTEARAFNLRLGRPSLDFPLRKPADELALSWSERLERERFERRVEEGSLEDDFERDHHDLLWVAGGTNDIWRLGRGRKECWNYEGKWN